MTHSFRAFCRKGRARLIPPPQSESTPLSEVHGHEMASLDGALHLEPIVRLPSCCSPQQLGGHHDTCEDQFGERSWGASAQENQNKGRIIELDHINGKITLQHAPTGTVGAVGASSLVDEYKIKDGLASDVHAGDEVDFTAAQIGGVWTITKIQKK